MNVLTKKIKFNNGQEIPQFGLGTYKLTDENEINKIISIALERGYLHIDTAQIYNNQIAIGNAIKNSGVKRENIFITSKIWNSDHEYEAAKRAIDKILAELQLDYIDLVLVHWPTPKKLECWKALEEAVEQGKIKSIGVSNFLEKDLDELLAVCKIKPVINQFELHPALQCKSLVDYLRKHNIAIESWGTMIRGKCNEFKEIKEIAEKHYKTPAQVCLRWAWQQEFVIIPKSSKPERLYENAAIADFELSPKDMEILASIPQYRDGPDPNDFDF